MEIQPESLSVAERYKLLTGCIVPRPIAFVSTISPAGETNLAPFSFFNGVGSNPMTVVFCPGNKPDGTDKDTLRNCLPTSDGGTAEFVINVALESYRREMAATAEPLPYGESEFDLTGLDSAPSLVVKPPRLAASPVALECRTMKVIRTNPGQVGGGNLVLGEVVHIYLDDGLINERYHIDPAKMSAIGRMGGLEYCLTRDRFSLARGRAALSSETD